MNINKNNYEETFIDYYDGNLSAEKVAELFLFLESNPKLKEEFESFSPLYLESSSLEFPFKDQLKKEEINAANFAQYMIASVEGDLNSWEIRLLENYLKLNPAHEKEFQLFRATKLIPSDEVYPHKRELKKAVPMLFNFSNTMKYAVAAILLLALIGGVYFTFIRSNEKSNNEFAEAPEKAIKKNNSNNTSTSQNNITELELKPIESSDRKETFSHPQTPQTANKVIKENTINKGSEPIQQIKSNQMPLNHNETLPIASVDVIQIKELHAETPEQRLKMNSPLAQSAFSAEPVAEEYLSVWEALRQASERKLQKAGSADGQELSSTDEYSNPRTSVKNIIGKSIEKISNDKVAINNESDPSSGTSRFSLALGNFKIEKEKVR